LNTNHKTSRVLRKKTQVAKPWPGPQRVLTLFSDEAEIIGMELWCYVLHPIIEESSTRIAIMTLSYGTSMAH